MVNPNKTVLIIENDQDTRELYQRDLNRYYRVLTCSDEIEAYDLVQTYSISTIVLEPALPSGQGWWFLAKLHALPQATNIPIILCSTLDERKRGMRLGATICLVKPVLPDVLHDVIREVIFASHLPL
jgi:DNA-binding response OmpR family regulator